MKKTVIALVLLLVILASTACAELYPMTTVVSKLDTELDLVYCTDFNGMIWVFEGIEDWEVGDIASMIMADNRTEQIIDDMIIQVRYSGYIEGI